ncbi:MAG: hypothetical protein AAFY57_03185 [Cyanobacteria bacterium J06642_2]
MVALSSGVNRIQTTAIIPTRLTLWRSLKAGKQKSSAAIAALLLSH